MPCRRSLHIFVKYHIDLNRELSCLPHQLVIRCIKKTRRYNELKTLTLNNLAPGYIKNCSTHLEVGKDRLQLFR